ncbi:MAG: undecaprenyldiphospho-muramoylpentapeptide beta-N-acetylglucosaminyltransferase [Gammaproteobacteria bacterium]
MTLKLLIVAGGTGGHVFPGLAVASRLKAKGISLAWIGTETGLESSCIPAAGISFHVIHAKNVRGKGWRRLMSSPYMMIKSLIEAILLLRKISPDVVLSMGGYVSGPVGLAAWILRIPLIVHEQNAIFGLTNRILSLFADKVIVAFQNRAKRPNHIHAGNPIRDDIRSLALKEKPQRNGAHFNLLVIGGSLGALAINQLLPKALALIPESQRPAVWHQTGPSHFELTQKIYNDENIEAKVVPFIEDMASAYEWADVLIARAGALTLAEVTALGLPSILIPFPYAVDDHQTANAQELHDAGGTLMIQQSALTPEGLSELILKFHQAPDLRLKMGRTAKQFAKIEATETVADLCLEVYRDKCA